MSQFSLRKTAKPLQRFQNTAKTAGPTAFMYVLFTKKILYITWLEVVWSYFHTLLCSHTCAYEMWNITNFRSSVLFQYRLEMIKGTTRSSHVPKLPNLGRPSGGRLGMGHVTMGPARAACFLVRRENKVGIIGDTKCPLLVSFASLQDSVLVFVWASSQLVGDPSPVLPPVHTLTIG